jgi:hypothetical protein
MSSPPPKQFVHPVPSAQAPIISGGKTAPAAAAHPIPLPDVPGYVTDVTLYEKAVVAVTGATYTKTLEYFQQRWRPFLAGSAREVIEVLWEATEFWRDSWRKDECVKRKWITIAQKAGLARSTVGAVLHRANARDIAQWERKEQAKAQRDETYTPRPCPFKPGDYTYSHYNRYVGHHIARFIRAIHSTYYVTLNGGVLHRGANQYIVSAIMPPVPADEPLVEAKYRELVDQALAEKTTPDPEVSSGGSHSRTFNADRKSDQQYRPKIGQQIPSSSKALSYSDEDRSRLRGEDAERVAEARVSVAQSAEQASNQDQTGAGRPDPDQIAEQNRINAQAKYQAAAAAGGPGRPPETRASAKPVPYNIIDPARAPRNADEQGGQDDALSVAFDLETQMGARHKVALNTARKLVNEMEIAGVPYAQMMKLLYHAKTYMWQEGHPDQPSRYYPTVVRSQIALLQEWRGDLEGLIKQHQEGWRVRDVLARGGREQPVKPSQPSPETPISVRLVDPEQDFPPRPSPVDEMRRGFRPQTLQRSDRSGGRGRLSQPWEPNDPARQVHPYRR